MRSNLTAKEFIHKLKKHVKIKQVSSATFYYYIPEANYKWQAAWNYHSQTIYLRNKQPYIFQLHELVHFIRQASPAGLISEPQMAYEELIAYKASYILAKKLNCKVSKLYRRYWNNWKKLYAKENPHIELYVKQAVKDLIKLAG